MPEIGASAAAQYPDCVADKACLWAV